MSRIVFPLALVGLMALGATAQQDASKKDANSAPAQPTADKTAEPAPAAASAKKAFDDLVEKWRQIRDQIQDLQPKRDKATGDDRAKLDGQIGDLRKQAEGIIDKLVDAGLAAYRADAKAYPDINATLVAIARFDMAGDSNGDGGDQYEKAVPIIKALLDGGAGDQWPQLWLWGGVAAYCNNDFALAEKYFTKSKQVSGDRGDSPPQVSELAVKFQGDLPTIRKTWESEKKIRDAEAKADNLPRVKFTTTKGDIVIELFEDEAPQSVANFLTLAKTGFYNGVVFHRVLPGFMAQGGDPEGTGRGGPGYNIKDEQRLPNARHHFRGSLSMANTGDPNTGGSQFFLTFVPTSYLDGHHAVFGRVIEGMDVAASLKRGEPPATPDKIIKAEVLRDRGHEYTFDKLPGR